MTGKWPYKYVDVDLYTTKTIWPKITVITASYNQGQFTEETILSVVNQDYKFSQFSASSLAAKYLKELISSLW